MALPTSPTDVDLYVDANSNKESSENGSMSPASSEMRTASSTAETTLREMRALSKSYGFSAYSHLKKGDLWPLLQQYETTRIIPAQVRPRKRGGETCEVDRECYSRKCVDAKCKVVDRARKGPPRQPKQPGQPEKPRKAKVIKKPVVPAKSSSSFKTAASTSASSFKSAASSPRKLTKRNRAKASKALKEAREELAMDILVAKAKTLSKSKGSKDLPNRKMAHCVNKCVDLCSVVAK